MNKYVAFFNEIGLRDLAETGGKGANLGELASSGFPVPPGFCVKIRAFDEYLEYNKMNNAVDALASRINYNSIPDIEGKTAEIRNLICEGAMPEKIASEIKEAYVSLGLNGSNSLVAVRSSVGTRDLSRSSFPGQMDTYHNITGIDNVLRLVKQCWASVWTARAATTAYSRGINYKMLIIAPLVQKMVASDIAGVLFTSNPANASESEMMINASWGLGESVVSGNVTPDQYIIDKRSLQILNRISGKKCFKIQLDTEKGAGNQLVPVCDEDAEKECLSEEQIRELSEMAVRIEQYYKEPQDIEWAFAGGRLYLLQSRKIAGLERMKQAVASKGEWISEFDTVIKNPPDTFTSQNIGESMPEVLTPASQSGLKVLDYGFWKTNHDLGLVKEDFPEDNWEYIFLGNFYGRAHLNLSAFKRIAGKVPGGSASEFERPESIEDEEKIETTRFAFRHFFTIPVLIFRGLRLRRYVIRDFDRLAEAVRRRIEINRSIDLDSLKIKEFAELFETGNIESMELMALHIANSQLALISYNNLRMLTKKWLNDTSSSFAARLVTGLSTLESARPGFAIYNLYKFISGTQDLRRIFLDKKPDEISENLKNNDSPDCRRFMELLSEFKRSYGYRCVSEAELMTPSWEYDLSYVFSVIKNYLKAGNVEDPELIEQRQKKDRIAAEKEAFSKLNIVKRVFFKKALEDARRFIPGRENNKALFIMGVNEGRRFYRALSEKLVRQEILKNCDDIYFLTKDEVKAVCLGETSDISKKISRRRDEYNRNRSVVLPDTFTGRPVQIDPHQEVKFKNILKGLPVSPGRVTGPARIILDPRKDQQIESGEILVVPVTDASWTPLFLLAKGLVVDIGGLLSHGSVVAREYGIPGVLNVLIGTKVIRNGQIITIDGTKGEVYLHDQDE